MPKIALVCSEPLRRTMAGAGIRYVEIARQLCAAGLDVSLIAPRIENGVLELPPNGREVVYSEALPARMDDLFDAVVVQGHLGHKLVPALPTVPLVVDLYDPALLENMSYAGTAAAGAYDSELEYLHAACRRADLFLCANERQRDFYLGWLTALGRVRPERTVVDAAARSLIDVLPFGVPETIAPYRPYLPARKPGIRRLLFGSLYDWYDPWTAIKALEQPALRHCELLFVRGPNPDTTPQRLQGDVERWLAAHDDGRIGFLDWAPWDRRFDLLRDVDLLVAPHPDTLESRFSMRTRFLEAIAAGCPVVTTAGGAAADLVAEYRAGSVIPPGDARALAREAAALLPTDNRNHVYRRETSKRFREDFAWRRVVAPLVGFCRNPASDRFRPDTATDSRASAPVTRRTRGARSFSVLVPTHNRLDALPRVLDGLRNQYRPPEFELIVVDDGSTDGTAGWFRAQSFPFPAKLVVQENRGPAAARNTATEHAMNEYVAFLGDDIIPDRFWLSSHARKHALLGWDPGVAVVGHTDWHREVRRTRFLDFIDRTGWQFDYDRIRDAEDLPFNYLYSSNLSLARDCMLRNPFNPDFRHACWEDTELGYRLRNQGASLKYEPAARAAHLHQPGVMRMAARHRRTGHVAVEFCRLHPELEVFLWPSPGNLAAASGPVARTMRKWYAAALEHFPVDLPVTWERLLRDHYAAGVRDYMKRHGLREIPEFNNWRRFPITYHANSPLLSHHTGVSRGQFWACHPARHRPGHCVFGPGFAVQDSGVYEARYFLHNDADDAKPGRFVTLDVYDQVSDRTIAAAPLAHADTPGAPGCITLRFSGRTGQRLEFRVYWHGACRLDVHRIELNRAGDGQASADS